MKVDSRSFVELLPEPPDDVPSEVLPAAASFGGAGGGPPAPDVASDVCVLWPCLENRVLRSVA